MKSICIGLLAVACAAAIPFQGAEAAKANLKILHSFGTGSDGMLPEGNLISVKGTLYGATHLGGAHGGGTVYALNPASSTESIIYSFCSQQRCADGEYPTAGLIDVKGVLYGTTRNGGTSGKGAVFSVDTKTGAEQVLYSFCSQQNCTDGQFPKASVIDVNGTIYGTTYGGGSAGKGTVFSVDPTTGAEQVVYSFCSQQSCADGSNPDAGMISANSLLYGTTFKGGAKGMGTVYSLDPGTGSEMVLYSFCSQQGCADGQYPLSAVIEENGTLYGTTYGGGSQGAFGTVYAVDAGTGAESVLYSFCSKNNCADGEFPYASLNDVNGTIYGTTGYGGEYNGGTLFSLDPTTGALSLINAFCTQQNCTDGGFPQAGVVDMKGTLFGTTFGGGTGYGTAFAIKSP